MMTVTHYMARRDGGRMLTGLQAALTEYPINEAKWVQRHPEAYRRAEPRDRRLSDLRQSQIRKCLGIHEAVNKIGSELVPDGLTMTEWRSMSTQVKCCVRALTNEGFPTLRVAIAYDDSELKRAYGVSTARLAMTREWCADHWGLQ